MMFCCMFICCFSIGHRGHGVASVGRSSPTESCDTCKPKFTYRGVISFTLFSLFICLLFIASLYSAICLTGERVPLRSSLMIVPQRGFRSRGVVDNVPSFDDVPPDLSFEDLQRTFPRFRSLEGLGEYRV
ncbi:uncharacterized protein DS421_20g694940 [Arachis hypogaea]|nr:uncharacterized protein DS421_20g694940 [Arachis hypogaea]